MSGKVQVVRSWPSATETGKWAKVYKSAEEQNSEMATKASCWNITFVSTAHHPV